MVERKVGNAERQSESLRIRGPHKECGSKTRPGRGHHRTEIACRDTRLFQSAPHQRIDGQQVIPRSNFGHNTSEAGMFLGL